MNYAIRQINIFDGIEIEDETIFFTSERALKDFIKDVETRTGGYAFKVKVKYQLADTPSISVHSLPCPEHKGKSVVLYKIIRTYKTKTPPPRHGLLFYLFVLIVVLSITGSVILNTTLKEEAKQTQIDSRCYYYLKNGKPYSVIIEGYEYILNQNGTLEKEERVFLNPFHEELLRELNEDQCLEINIKE